MSSCVRGSIKGGGADTLYCCSSHLMCQEEGANIMEQSPTHLNRPLAIPASNHIALRHVNPII